MDTFQCTRNLLQNVEGFFFNLLQLENSKAECARKDTEVYALRTQMETLQKQGDDHQQHIVVLREQISAKEQQSGMLQADVSGTVIGRHGEDMGIAGSHPG